MVSYCLYDKVKKNEIPLSIGEKRERSANSEVSERARSEKGKRRGEGESDAKQKTKDGRKEKKIKKKRVKR